MLKYALIFLVIAIVATNRIYEGSLYGVGPIGVAGVETGRWLAKRKAGVILEEPVEQQLINFFQYLDLVHASCHNG